MRPDAPTYTRDELAHTSGTSGRTIRFYQAQGILPRPRRVGRDARYDETHRQRLRLIGELQDRGMTLSGIRALLARDDRAAVSVADWLRIDETLRGPWSEDRPRLYTPEELTTLLGDADPGLLASLERNGYLVRQDGGTTWLSPSPLLLDLALRLYRGGVAIDLSAQARDLLRRRLARAVDDVVELFVARTGNGFAGLGTSEEVTRAVDALRPVARESASVIIAEEVERALRRLVEGGPPAGARRPHARRR